jgi:hypothetical protein
MVSYNRMPGILSIVQYRFYKFYFCCWTRCTSSNLVGHEYAVMRYL